MDSDASKLRLDMSSLGRVSSAAVDTSAMCFAVNVTGPGITSLSNGCGYTVGIASGLVKSGQILEVTVPKGSDRKIELLRYELASSSDACPALNLTNCSSATLCSTFPSGETLGVNLSENEQVVTISLSTASRGGISSGAVCGPGTVFATLTSGGQIIDQNGLPISGYTDGATFQSITWNSGSLETWDASGKSSSGLAAPSFVRSITRDPEGQQLYGLIGGNQLVSLNGTGGMAVLATCPFESCVIPKWIQSISIGYGKRLFAVDAAGAVYRITSSGLSKVTDLSPIVTHVVMQ